MPFNKTNPAFLSAEIYTNEGQMLLPIHLFDTVSLVCGDSLGLKFCGENRDL
jgi:hypothetical protein